MAKIYEFKRNGKLVLTPREREMLKAFRRMTPAMRKLVLAAIAEPGRF